MSNVLPPPDPCTHVPPRGAVSSTVSTPPLERPRDGRRMAGVCAGVADRYGWDRTTVRVLAVLSVFLPGPQVLAYLIAWLVIPSADG